MMLRFPVDRPIRNRYFVPESYNHPAKLHLGLLQWSIDRWTQPGDVVADPMAGTGSLLLAALQQRHVILREIEPRFLALCHANAAQVLEQAGLLAGQIDIASHDAREPWDVRADVIITSPPYANDAAATTKTRCITRKARKLATVDHDPRWQRWVEKYDAGSHAAFLFHYGEHPAQIGHWRGERYWQAMTLIYRNAYDALRDGGRMVLVIKDHIKDGQRVHVADRTVALCQSLGFVLDERHARRVWPLSLWQRRRLEQGKPVVDTEDVLVFVKGGAI